MTYVLRSAIALVAIAATLATAIVAPPPAQADAAATRCRHLEPLSEPPVIVCRSDTWIHDSGPKLANAAALGVGAYPTWDDQPPDDPNGAGATAVMFGYDDQVDGNDDETSFIVEGQVTGNLDNLAATLFVSLPGLSIFSSHAVVRLELTVDGTVVLPDDPDRPHVVQHASGLPRSTMRFALTGIHSAAGLDNDPAAQHTVRLRVVSPPVPLRDDPIPINGPLNSGLVYYDSVQSPSGIVFNIEDANLGPYTRIPTG